MADATTIGPHAIAATGKLLIFGQVDGRNFTPRGAWTGPPSRAREEGAEKYLGGKTDVNYV
jgi:hypothetical protein